MTKHLLFSIFTVGFLLGANCLQAQVIISLSTPANAGILSESCGGPYSLIFDRRLINIETSDDITVNISDLGAAQMGTDYTFPAGTFPLLLQPIDTIVIIPITVINDGSPEGFETLIWKFDFQIGSGTGTLNDTTGITDSYDVEIQSTEDTIQWCRYAPLQLTASSTAQIHWSPTFAFDDPTGSDVTVRPFLSGWYYATVGSDTCGATDSVYLDLAIVEIQNQDTVYICNDGDGVMLNGHVNDFIDNFIWIPADTTLSDPTILTPIANPTITTTYILQSNLGFCIAADTVVVRVDSLPQDLHIDIAPFKAYYCAGEVVALFSHAYDSLNFPDIDFLWKPDNNTFESDMTLLNAALTLQDTTMYIREVTNNACVSKDSILINVVPPSVAISVTDTILCPGEMFMVSILNTQVTEPEWTPTDGLSCDKCLNPKVTVTGTPGTTVVYQFSGKILECPVGASLPIEIPPLQLIGISGDNVVCQGDMEQLTVTDLTGLTDLHWEVVFGDASLSCTNCISPVVTINSPGPININLSATTSNPNYCGAGGFFQFVPGEQIQVTPQAIDACLGGTVVVTTGNPDYINPVWEVSLGDLILSCSECPAPTVTVNGDGTLKFIAEISGSDTCRIIGAVNIGIYEGDESNLVVVTPEPPNPIGQGSSVTVLLAVNPTPSGNITWNINGANIGATGTTIEFNANEVVNFIEATFINSLGCEQKDTLSIPTVPASYMIPNAFTPNSDDINDNFKIIIIGNIVIEKFMIFNRWGQKVYEAAEDDLEGWDGRWKNELAASDTYAYMATLVYPGGRKETAKGDVILLR